MISFEAGVEALKRFIGRGGDEAYFANESDPLHAAFRAKATVHAGPIGLPMLFGAARSKLEALSAETRTKEAVAYVHVPFCSTRCLYCMFYQNPFDEAASHRYAELLEKEFGLWASRPVQSRESGGEISALYFGGGTPPALAPQDIELIVAAARRELPLAKDCEITLEGRVSDMMEERLEAAARAGVNRLSIGVQTFHGDIRRAMMRVDDRDGILRAIERMARFDEFAVVIDLIYGFPMQTEAVWTEDLEIARNLPIDGIDCYQLNVFSRSPLAKRIKACRSGGPFCGVRRRAERGLPLDADFEHPLASNDKGAKPLQHARQDRLRLPRLRFGCGRAHRRTHLHDGTPSQGLGGTDRSGRKAGLRASQTHAQLAPHADDRVLRRTGTCELSPANATLLAGASGFIA